jgi:FixJ family two-component response regulator
MRLNNKYSVVIVCLMEWRIRTAMNRGAYDFITKPIDLRFEITIENL